MSNIDIIRAWRDKEYRMSLSADQRASLPNSPAGTIDVSEAHNVRGGVTGTLETFRCGSACYQFSC